MHTRTRTCSVVISVTVTCYIFIVVARGNKNEIITLFISHNGALHRS